MVAMWSRGGGLTWKFSLGFEKPVICREHGMTAQKESKDMLQQQDAVDCWQRDAMLCNGPLMFIDILSIRQVKILIHDTHA